MDEHLSDMLQAKAVPMGGVFEMMNAAIKGHKQRKTAELARFAAARGMGMPGH